VRRRCLRVPAACACRLTACNHCCTCCRQLPPVLLALPGMGALCFPALSVTAPAGVDVPSVPTRSPYLAGYTDYPTLEETEEGKAFLAAQAN
jgi:hypothetical protein